METEKLTLTELLGGLAKFGLRHTKAQETIHELIRTGERAPDLEWGIKDHPLIDDAVLADDKFMTRVAQRYQAFLALYQELERRRVEYRAKR